METSFIYHLPTKVYFGPNQLQHLKSEVTKYGKRILLIYNGQYVKDSGLYQQVIEQLSDFTVVEYTNIKSNPRHTDINEAIILCKNNQIDVLLTIGGGSAIDSAKAIGIGYYYEGDVWDLVLEPSKITGCLPIITILTIAATGSEMDAGAVISNKMTNEKIAFKYSEMLPKVSFMDPTLTFSVNSYQTACGCVDILSHILESYFSPNESLHMLDAIMESLVRTVISYGPIAYHNPSNYEARANLMWCASWAINDFIRSDKKHKWSMHPIEHELSAFYDITHGLGLAIVMPRWLRFVAKQKDLLKFKQLAIHCFGVGDYLKGEEYAEIVISKIEDYCYNLLGLPMNLSQLKIDDSHFEAMADKLTDNTGCYQGGYVKLYKSDILKILNDCLY